MPIRYKVASVNVRGEEHKCPKIVPGQAISPEEFAEKVARRAARSLTDVSAMLIAASEVLVDKLNDEQAVRIPGLGTFRLSLKGELDDAQHLVTDSARLKINFRAERGIMDQVKSRLRFDFVGEGDEA